MNIITGDSETGKTALIHVVDYCLGSSSCNVPEGIIRNSVLWYALRITDGSAEHFIARRAPDTGRASNSGVYYLVGSAITIPAINEISVTTNIDTVVARIKNVTGLALSIHEPPEGQTRSPITATLRHALAFSFQPQNEISQPGFLFHNQGDNWTAQAIKDTLPYFLGAVDDDYVANKARLRALRQQQRDKERTLSRLEAVADGGLSEAANLLTEGRAAGLLEPDLAPDSWASAVETLQRAATASPEEQLIRYEQSSDQEELTRLNDERASLRQLLTRSQDELSAMKALLSEENGYTREITEQVSRLRSLNLFTNNSDTPCCPLCDQPTTELLPSTETLSVELDRASEQLARVTRHTPGLAALIIEQEQRISDTKGRWQENRNALEALQRNDDRLMQLRDGASRRAYVLGRISLFLETLPQVADNSELRNELAQLQQDIELLERDLSDEMIQERLDSILSFIARSLTEWAERLVLEHRGNPFRLDLRHLQIIADVATGPIRMDRMGSGANWLGCHLIAHLALHSWFVRKSRPVPRFLFLDQPSQVYYPAEEEVESSLRNIESEDRLAVLRMFELIRDVVNELHPDFQIIITEHADIAEDWYQEAIVERWRDGNALIPSSWISNEP
ncbi:MULTISPECIES: DUF3732 domain-containing protein [Cyanophyceae]|uniref:DUF3732 domain-containing protein n=1 Tax=Cyanophyceae TaxID=3028117 RepID=UPI0018EF4AAE|nr:MULTISPECIES: DUF3732 domain-containing protein [Cyanophyceae]